MSRRAVTMVAVLAVLGLASTAHAYDPISWHSINGGGVLSATGGVYHLDGTIGQSALGLSSGGTYSLNSGFWLGVRTPVGVGDGPPTAASGVFRFFRPTPNPVRSGSRVAFDLPRASRVALSMFDFSGRVVRRWDFGMLPAGHQERTWNGTDAGGRPLPAGVYLLRLTAGRDQGVHRVLVLP